MMISTLPIFLFGENFIDLNDFDATQVAWFCGIHTWVDRNDLNNQWINFAKEMDGIL